MKLLALMFALFLGACATAPMPATVEATNDTDRIASGAYSSPAWVNEKFTGVQTRKLTNNVLTFEIDQSVDGGGWDTAVAMATEPRTPVRVLNHQTAICFDYTLNFDPSKTGKWWVGPKISVNWAAMTDEPSTGEWYENYVVEMANQSPQDLEADLFNFFEAESLGESVIDGATYRHVKLRFMEWWQYWSIRQEYRSEGTMAVGPILQAWTGLPDNLPYDGVKANIETHGPVSGAGTITADFADRRADAHCK